MTKDTKTEAQDVKVNTSPVFFSRGRTVNGKGEELGEDGQPVKAEGAAEDGQLGALTAERDDLKQQVETVTGERDAARKAIADGKLLPDDLLARIKAVKGVGDTLADAIHTALTAPAGR